jgi:hypothetical protein
LPFLAPFQGREVVFGLFSDAFVVPVAAAGQDVGEQVADGLAACQVQAARGDDGVAGGVVAGDADGHGERDPVRVEAGLPGGVGFQGAERLVDGEECEQFLADQLGGPGAQYERGAAQPGLQLGVAVLDGLITNDKFCCVRRVQLSLTWSRRPLRLRASFLQSDVAVSGEPDDPDPDVDRLPPAQPAPRRRAPVGSGLSAAGALGVPGRGGPPDADHRGGA